jgi:glycosidase
MREWKRKGRLRKKLRTKFPNSHPQSRSTSCVTPRSPKPNKINGSPKFNRNTDCPRQKAKRPLIPVNLRRPPESNDSNQGRQAFRHREAALVKLPAKMLIPIDYNPPTPANHIPVLSRVVVYEANLRAFGRGHNFINLKNRLRQIQALGATVLWLMPVQPIGQVRKVGLLGSPYSIRDYEEVNPEFGSSQDLKELIQTAHELHMGVILDWVADHTSWDNPWIKAHPSWYLKSPDGKIQIPTGTNWNDVAALDYSNLKMRAEMVREMWFWIDRYKVDGFRCDAADRLPIDFWKEAIGFFRSTSPKRLLMLSEGHRLEDYAAGFNLTYGWDFANRLREIYAGKSAKELAPAVQSETRDLPAGARRLDFITNHDIDAFDASLTDLYKTPQGVRTAFTIEALYSGDPLIYSGLEIAYDKRLQIFEETDLPWNSDPITSNWISKVIEIRTSNSACLTGSLTDFSTANAVIFERKQAENTVLVIANVRNTAVEAKIDPKLIGKWNKASLGSTVSLEPYGCRILVRTTHPKINSSK